MNKFILALPILVLSCSVVFSAPINKPNRRDRTGIDYTINGSSWIPSSALTQATTSSVLISSGSVGVHGIYVSSPGVNSKIIILNHGSTNPVFSTDIQHVGQFLTNTQGWIPLNIDLSTGGTNDGFSIVITSSILQPPFQTPSLFIPYERKR